MYRSGKDTVKNILLFNILIYLFSSRISHNRLTDLCTTWRDGCYYSELEHLVLAGTGSDNQDRAGTGTAYELAAMLTYVCDQQVSFGQIMFSPPNKIFPVRRCTPPSGLVHVRVPLARLVTDP